MFINKTSSCYLYLLRSKLRQSPAKFSQRTPLSREDRQKVSLSFNFFHIHPHAHGQISYTASCLSYPAATHPLREARVASANIYQSHGRNLESVLDASGIFFWQHRKSSRKPYAKFSCVCCWRKVVINLTLASFQQGREKKGKIRPGIG